MKTLLEINPNASQEAIRRNPHLLPKKDNKMKRGASSTQRNGKLNRTEAEFALRLEAMRRNGEILRYDYEGITLRWNGVSYTPDFVVMRDVNMTPDADNWLVFIEVKGAFTGGKFERAIERFRHARTFWTQFSFECHQKQKMGWKRIM